MLFGGGGVGWGGDGQLGGRPPAEGGGRTDFGIRSSVLAHGIMGNEDATMLVDGKPQGNLPGTIYLIEPDLKKLDELPIESVNAHSMNPVRVLQLVRSLGGFPGWLRVVGCEPAVLESEEGAMGLSENVQAAIGPAMELIEGLIQEISSGTENPAAPIEAKTGNNSTK